MGGEGGCSPATSSVIAAISSDCSDCNKRLSIIICMHLKHLEMIFCIIILMCKAKPGCLKFLKV